MNPNASAIAAYLRHLQTVRKLSPHTLDGYGRDLQQLRQLADALDLGAIATNDIRRYAATLHARGLEARSIARKLSCWRGFFEWLAEQTTLACNPVDGVKPPKRAKTLPKALGVDDAVHLVSATTAAPGMQATPEQICNHAMFELLYSSGLRVAELVGVDLRYTRIEAGGHVSAGWLDLDGGEVTITGKGQKMRSVPVGQAALAAIKAWLPVRATLARQDDSGDAAALFVSSRGTRISPRLVQLRLKAHGQALGIPANVHPHVLRHSFASHVLQSSGDLRAVQEMLGHASITSTQVYTALDFQRLAQVYDSAHPRAKKKPL
jgi:integrase/recombinase XerC